MSFRGLRWVQAGMVCMALALTGCMSPDEDDTPNEVTTLSGTVTGTVLDSNGSPIEGVVVRYTGAVVKAAVSAVTNDAGQFELPGVVVRGSEVHVDALVANVWWTRQYFWLWEEDASATRAIIVDPDLVKTRYEIKAEPWVAADHSRYSDRPWTLIDLLD